MDGLDRSKISYGKVLRSAEDIHPRFCGCVRVFVPYFHASKIEIGLILTMVGVRGYLFGSCIYHFSSSKYRFHDLEFYPHVRTYVRTYEGWGRGLWLDRNPTILLPGVKFRSNEPSYFITVDVFHEKTFYENELCSPSATKANAVRTNALKPYSDLKKSPQKWNVKNIPPEHKR